MYAVIRAGGKQYRVAPGDVIRVENQGTAPTARLNSATCWRFGRARADWQAQSARARDRRNRGAGREENPGLPLQAQEAIQEAARTSSGIYGGADYRDCV